MREKMSPAKQKIESVIFDLGGVLIEDPVPRILQYCAAFLQADPGRLRSAHCRHAPDFQKGAISEELFWNRICSEISTLMPRIHSLWGEAFRMAYSEKKRSWPLRLKSINETIRPVCFPTRKCRP